MLMTLVLTRSYAGNLMSLLAVRHISEPYQTGQDFLDDPSATMIWVKGSGYKQYIYAAESGTYHTVADLDKEGRILFAPLPEFPRLVDTLVRRGDHVLNAVLMSLRIYMADEFKRK
ncbi:putative olfactory ionotropic receptor IR7-like 3, partial [Homarus americanus]